ncbi:glycoside hydrolase family 75 protein [Planotetraspora sp. A-T 1434]|uniref:glycoside hydrolase family 75 protein n=1 Tax=Planotetraspora sp. A-T 1434 TaxID=2979219 RepID=UPI0021C1EFE2|nr:glycoside hydrolase family 75 protein [Planotetraspora sp. A-T 1434]MCT9929008.1 glycoside hydrolase family 75 protein [Planotetraspora sp. A-T 1434]
MKTRLLSAFFVALSLCFAVAGPSPASATTSSVLAYAAWAPNTAYAVGARVTYNGVDYECLQAHTSQVGWEPPNVPALWKSLGTGGGGGGDTTAPSVPTSLRVTGTTSSSVSLAWNASTDNVGVTGYQVFRGGSLVTTVTGTSYTNTGLASSTTYSFTVKARDAAGNLSAASSAVSATTATGGGGGGGTVTADQLLAKVTTCSQISSGKYKTDSDSGSATVPVCNKNGAVFWKADMDIDCDGVRTTQCNENTDCCYQNDTFCHTSGNSPLNAATLPYVVIPSTSSIWNYTTKGIGCGTVVAVIYNGKIEYAVMGDTGPSGIIGEASYKTASDLGINPDPSNGGTDSGVTYIVFTGSGTKVAQEENHSQAVTLGNQLAQQFINNN